MEIRRSRGVRLLQAILILGAVLSLVSCGVLSYIFGSVFPSTVMLAKAQADLAGSIPAGDGGAFQVRVVETGGNGYVIVTGNPPSGSKAFVYDLDLNQKATFDTASGLIADGVMVDVNGNLVVGNLLLTPSTLAVGPTISNVSPSTNASSGNDGFVDHNASTTNPNIVSFFINSNTMSWTAETGAWSAPTSPSPNPTLSSNTSAGLQLFAVFDDGDTSTSGKVYFVVGTRGNNESGKAYFFSALKYSFTSTSIATNVVDSAPSRDNLEINSFGYANGSIFAYDQSAASFVKINPSDGSIQASFYSPTDVQDIRYAYRTGGGSFYAFDPDTRVLTKYGAWW